MSLPKLFICTANYDGVMDFCFLLKMRGGGGVADIGDVSSHVSPSSGNRSFRARAAQSDVLVPLWHPRCGLAGGLRRTSLLNLCPPYPPILCWGAS